MALRWDADGPARLPRDGGGGPGAVGDGEGSELPLLTSAQMAEFVANGMLVLRLQLPEPWLRDFYDQAQQLVESGADRSAMWEAIDPQVNAITADPTLRGAFTSILGEDYLMPPNGTLHSRGPGADQAFHKVRLALSRRRPQSSPCSLHLPLPVPHRHPPAPAHPTPRAHPAVLRWPQDGTDHGPLQNTVRDHRLRRVLAFVYPVETTIEMGPT